MPWKPAKMIRFLKKNGFVEVPTHSTGHRRFINNETKRTKLVRLFGISKKE